MLCVAKGASSLEGVTCRRTFLYASSPGNIHLSSATRTLYACNHGLSSRCEHPASVALRRMHTAVPVRKSNTILNMHVSSSRHIKAPGRHGSSNTVRASSRHVRTDSASGT